MIDERMFTPPTVKLEANTFCAELKPCVSGNHIYRASRYSFDLTLTGW